MTTASSASDGSNAGQENKRALIFVTWARFSQGQGFGDWTPLGRRLRTPLAYFTVLWIGLIVSLLLVTAPASAAPEARKRIATKSAAQPASAGASAPKEVPKPFLLAHCRLANGDMLTAACPIDAKVTCIRGEQAIRCDGRKAESTSRVTAAEQRSALAPSR
jgi:hypothetical protein